MYHDKTISHMILIIIAVRVVNDDIIFNVVLHTQIIVVSVVNDQHFWSRSLEMYSSSIHENHSNQRSHW